MARVVPYLFLSVLQLVFVSGVLGATFTISNNCEHTVWPGLLSGAGTSPLPTTGFPLQKGESRSISAPTNWSGRIWGRTQCAEDSTGKFTCVTGDCGSGKMECAGGGALPATLAEFTLDGSGGLDFYDVSLVDGYNLPMVVVPQGGSGNCTTTGCVVELNGACPSELRVAAAAGGGGESVACRSACEAFNAPEYCCSGAYATPDTCKPSAYSEFFKHACPRAYSYAYDDSTSTFTCAAADYAITFCPNFSSKKSAATGEGNGRPEAVQPPLVNASMIFTGMEYASDAASRGGAYSRLLAISAWALLAYYS
ncbi:hypothetical protein H6P81_018484 [Aristolochia fimbriata]|uniref:Thaumatin-like protein 1 n=1 Tax=Aristolochia fimbriata TaxID=158543 RepID=A0AAV7E3C0_ARIFI|nr:hypothetical protein H6P81_018484 [Aristolochia fimbriata]